MIPDKLEQVRLRSMDDNGFGPRIMMRLQVCPHCGTVGTVNQFFCRECRRPLTRRSLYQRYKERHRCCPNCDTVTPDAAAYCPQCGTRM